MTLKLPTQMSQFIIVKIHKRYQHSSSSVGMFSTVICPSAHLEDTDDIRNDFQRKMFWMFLTSHSHRCMLGVRAPGDGLIASLLPLCVYLWCVSVDTVGLVSN